MIEILHRLWNLVRALWHVYVTPGYFKRIDAEYKAAVAQWEREIAVKVVCGGESSLSEISSECGYELRWECENPGLFENWYLKRGAETVACVYRDGGVGWYFNAKVFASPYLAKSAAEMFVADRQFSPRNVDNARMNESQRRALMAARNPFAR